MEDTRPTWVQLGRAESERPLILVTNDDGVASPGLRAAVHAVCDLGEVWVVAPREQQSAMGRSYTQTDGVLVREAYMDGETPISAFSLRTSPANVVLYAMAEVLPRLPDLAISGINYGENVGSGITGSGTVGAALEAAGWGVPSIAISLEAEPHHYFSHSDEVDFTVAGVFLRRFARAMLRHPLPPGVDLLKIDVPSDATPQTPWRLTRVSRQRYLQPTLNRSPDGSRNGPLGYEVKFDLATLEPDSDVAAMRVDRVVSVTPLTIDLSAYRDGMQAHPLFEDV